MKRFIKEVLLSILVFVIIILICEVGFGFIPNSYSYKYKYVSNHKDDISILLMGHSHVLRGVDPYLLGDSVFNFAESARWIYYDAKLLEHFVPIMPNLRVVIFPIGYDKPFGEGSYHYEEDNNAKECYDSHIHMYAKYQHIPYDRFPKRYTYSSVLLSGCFSIKEIGDIACDSLGFERQEGVLHWGANWKDVEKVHLSDEMIDDDFHTNKYALEYMDYLTKMAEVCAKYNVRFITITTPCHPVYVAETSVAGMNNIKSIVDCVSKLYPIEYYNYLDDSEFRNDSCFLDYSHLNYYGSEKFTLRIKYDLGL